ncbi:hypothetical protein [Brevundimonas goettingensis]|uniref:Lipoprotein n=1 Tax=Brevundimonas goettingensis TaxID=2774190 RepID=A0A975C1U0_9CAUL|nr:hypothetical protein [Brevundimonas goettingensis]QTC90904.1 hypothetical protein IFJ75_17010 [Brevundimonas goettingensis]
MRRFAVLSTAVVATLSACATDPAGPGGPPSSADNGNDCAVIAAVAREHYGFNTTDRLPPPLWLKDGDRTWNPRCDWSRYGVGFPRTYDPATRSEPGKPVQWVSFDRPVYDGRGATVQSGIMHGPLAGMGVECRVISGFAGWTVGNCKNTWIS